MPGSQNMVKAMKRVALSEIKDDLSRYLRLAENEEIVITIEKLGQLRNRTIAE